MAAKLRRALSSMHFGHETWSAAREEGVEKAAGDMGTIVARAVMGRKFLDVGSGVSLHVVGIQWPAHSNVGHLTLENTRTKERARKRCEYDAMTHVIKMHPA